MEHQGEPVRAVQVKACIMPITAAARHGFGNMVVTSRLPGGGMATLEQKITYQMLGCQCAISENSELGAICPWCRAEREREQQLVPSDCPLTPEELDWTARVCRSCTRTCCVPMCNRSGCGRHFATVDGQVYCIEHLAELEIQKRRTELGAVVFHVARAFKSLRIEPEDP